MTIQIDTQKKKMKFLHGPQSGWSVPAADSTSFEALSWPDLPSSRSRTINVSKYFKIYVQKHVRNNVLIK
jgi:hypothetical protein